MHDKKHMWLMVLACAVPLLLILALPLFGIKGNFTWIAIIVMFAMHILFMGVMHKEENDHAETTEQKSGKKNRGCH